MTRVFGQPIRRNEDERLVTGMGNFVDDVSAPNALDVAFLRSPEAHARITSLDISRAREHPGVVAVYTHEDLGEHDIELPLMIPHPCMPYPKTQRLLAHDEVHYVGQTIAMIVAESRYIAEDALELIELDYEPLPAVVDIEAAVAGGVDTTHTDSPATSAPISSRWSATPTRRSPRPTSCSASATRSSARAAWRWRRA